MADSRQDHARAMARAKWDRMTPEQRAADGRERFLVASVNTVEKRASDLTGDQVDRILCALAEKAEGQRREQEGA